MTGLRAVVATLAVQVALAGCGSSDSDKTAPFVGAWTVSTGSLTANCAAVGMPFTQKLDGAQQMLTKTADGAISMTILTGCNILLDPSGNVATLRATTPPQMCMFTFPFMGTNLPVMGTFTSGNFTVAGTTASFNYMGTANAGPITCTVVGTGMSTKGAAPTSDGGAAADVGATADTSAASDTVPPADTVAAADTGSAADTSAATDTVPAADTGSTTD